MSIPTFHRSRSSQAVATLISTLAFAAHAQSTPPVMESIEVRSAAGTPSLQALPSSATVLDAEHVQDRQMQVNLSESLASVPGLQIKNRSNYAQDLQLSVRGYGARSTFGVRGVRLYVDGIPATMPDGQGSLGHIDIASLERVEVLRGPYSALYGNSAGGVVSMFTETPEGAPYAEGGFSVGSHGQKRLAAKVGGQTAQGLSYVVSASRFMTDGYRNHSAADRNVANAKLSTVIDDARLTVVANTMRSSAQDPQGLTWEQYRNHPRKASMDQNNANAPVATYFDTRKSLEQTQIGATYERQLSAAHSMALAMYAGHRTMAQYQSIPLSFQNNNRHAGAVIDLSRDYMGLDARWTGQFNNAPTPVTITAGLAIDTVQEDRKGFTNFTGTSSNPSAIGVQGTLKRDETNTITNTDPYAQATWKLSPQWTLDTGLRYSRVKFKVEDAFIQGNNPDDSAHTAHRQWLPIAALSYQPSPYHTVYASAGRGFETPTLAEMSYRPDGNSGMHIELRPSASTQYELGYRQRLTGAIQGRWSAAAFHSDNSNEIASNGTNNGRTTYKNAGATRRYGAELQADLKLTRQWQLQAAYTYLHAQFREGDLAGRMLPGLSQQQTWMAINYRPDAAWRLGMSAQHASKVYANDANNAAAPAYTVVSASVGWRQAWGPWTLDAFARVDNLLNQQYVGSVIVNDSNNRFFESAPGRNWATGISLRHQF